MSCPTCLITRGRLLVEQLKPISECQRRQQGNATPVSGDWLFGNFQFSCAFTQSVTGVGAASFPVGLMFRYRGWRQSHCILTVLMWVRLLRSWSANVERIWQSLCSGDHCVKAKVYVFCGQTNRRRQFLCRLTRQSQTDTPLSAIKRR